jgi:hypothetical protein
VVPQPPATQPPAPPSVQSATEFLPPARYSYYVVSAPQGAPAFAVPDGSGAPVQTFGDGKELSVTGISTDRRWLRVLTPQGQTAYVSSALVTVGARFGK